MPPHKTAIQSPKIGFSNLLQIKIIKTIKLMLSITGAIEGGANFSREFKIPIIIAEIHIKIRYGNIILRVLVINGINPSFINPGAITEEIKGAKIIPITTRNNETINKRFKTIDARCHAGLFPSLWRYLTKTGINEDDRAPSPKSILAVFGIIHAAKNMPLNSFEKKWARRKSLIKPNILLKNIPRLTILACFASFLWLSIIRL